MFTDFPIYVLIVLKHHLLKCLWKSDSAVAHLTALGHICVSLSGCSSLKSCIVSWQLAVSACVPRVAFWDTSVLHYEARACSRSEIPAYCKMLLVAYLCTVNRNNTILPRGVCWKNKENLAAWDFSVRQRPMQGLIIKGTSEEATVAVWFHRSTHIYYSLACCSFSVLEAKQLACNGFGQRFSEWKLKHDFHCGKVYSIALFIQFRLLMNTDHKDAFIFV